MYMQCSRPWAAAHSIKDDLPPNADISKLVPCALRTARGVRMNPHTAMLVSDLSKSTLCKLLACCKTGSLQFSAFYLPFSHGPHSTLSTLVCRKLYLWADGTRCPSTPSRNLLQFPPSRAMTDDATTHPCNGWMTPAGLPFLQHQHTAQHRNAHQSERGIADFADSFSTVATLGIYFVAATHRPASNQPCDGNNPQSTRNRTGTS